jgi:hypothetical protein
MSSCGKSPRTMGSSSRYDAFLSCTYLTFFSLPPPLFESLREVPRLVAWQTSRATQPACFTLRSAWTRTGLLFPPLILPPPPPSLTTLHNHSRKACHCVQGQYVARVRHQVCCGPDCPHLLICPVSLLSFIYSFPPFLALSNCSVRFELGQESRMIGHGVLSVPSFSSARIALSPDGFSVAVAVDSSIEIFEVSGAKAATIESAHGGIILA